MNAKTAKLIKKHFYDITTRSTDKKEYKRFKKHYLTLDKTERTAIRATFIKE